MSSVAVDNFVVNVKNVWKRMILLRNNLFIVSLCSNSSTSVRFPQTMFQLSIMVTFANINTQSSNIQGEHWIMMANFRHELCFADSLGCKGYSFLNNQHYKQMMPAPVQSHPIVCGFYTILAAFHLFKFRQEEIIRVHDVNVLSFISNYM